MLYFILLLLSILCLIAVGIFLNSKIRAAKKAPPFLPVQPAQIYYPKQEKKIVDTPAQAATVEAPLDLPSVPFVNEFRRPRRPVHIKDIVNSKFNFSPERKRVDRTSIPEHDEAVYREAERLRILRESQIVEERNRRYLAQKQSERYHK
jgi:hypothetical protein